MQLRPALGALFLVLAVGCVGGDGPPAPQPAVQSTADSGEAAATPPPGDPGASEDGTTMTATPSVAIKGRCTPQPQEGEAGEELVANLRVANTGNVGIVVRVATRWPMGSTDGVMRWTKVRVPEGKTKPLDVVLAVDSSVADQVRDAVAKNRKCGVRRRITGAFGVPES